MSKTLILDKAPQRFALVDSVRGIAVVLMAVFHFCFDLRYFGVVDWGVPNGDGWWQFRYLILSLFIGTLGISLSLAHMGSFRKKTFVWRQAKLGLSALAISFASVFIFPHSWIYFGILHFIFFASLFCVALVQFPRIALVVGLAILVGYWSDILSLSWPFVYFRDYVPSYTEDFVPFFPWLGVAFIGVFIGAYIKTNNPHFCHFKEPVTAKVGRHALPIYLLHQPIFFALFYLYFWLFS